MQEDILLLTPSNGKEMRKAVELWQVIIALVSLILAMWGAASMYASKIEDRAAVSATVVENHEQRIKQLEADRNETKQDIKDIKNTNLQILLLLKDKQDRR